MVKTTFLQVQLANIVKFKNSGMQVAKVDKISELQYPQTGIELIQYKFIYNNKTLILYNFMVFGEKDNPYAISEKNHLLFFKKRDDNLIWESTKLCKKYDLPQKTALKIDLESLLNVIIEEEFDYQTRIIDCIDTFWDLLKTIGLDFPNRYQTLSYSIINHFTFNYSVDEFCEKKKYTRKFLKSGMLKIQETILQNAVVYQAETDSYIDMMEYIGKY